MGVVENIMINMIKGRRYKKDNLIFFYDPNSRLHPFRILFPEGGTRSIVWEWMSAHDWEEVKPWYESIDEPVLCWVWDEKPECMVVALIVDYKEGYIYPFRSPHKLGMKLGYGYKNAKPVTREEIDNLILGGANEVSG